MKHIFAIIFCISFSGSVSAATWSDYTDIGTMYAFNADGTGTIYFQFSQFVTSAGCRTDANGIVALKKENILFREIYAAILSSSAQGKQVRYYVDGCDSSGWPVLQMLQSK
jgi:hypothetical protein